MKNNINYFFNSNSENEKQNNINNSEDSSSKDSISNFVSKKLIHSKEYVIDASLENENSEDNQAELFDKKENIEYIISEGKYQQL